jgi:two-component system sensor histidine kinase GlrK
MMMLANLVSLVSLRSLVAAGFALTVLPCVLAVLFSVLALEELARASKETAYQVAQLSEKTQILRERLTTLERKGRQYMVLKDAALRDSYAQTHRQVRQMVLLLEYYTEEPEFREKLSAIKELNDKLVQIMGHSPPLPSAAAVTGSQSGRKASSGKDAGRPRVQRVDELFSRISELGEDIGHLSSRSIDRMVAELERKTSVVQNDILFRTGILIPASLLLITVFIYLITHPIRQLDRAIRQLGTGNLSDPIEVVGPRDLRYLGQRLEWLRDQLTTLERAKQQFVRNVSHELKTPLANLHEGATLLADQIVGEINSEQQGIIEIMLNNSHRLEHLISELIHYGSASGHRDRAKRERTDLREIVRAVINDYELRLRSKSITLIQRLQPVQMRANREQLRLVVDNLLSNAVKYTPDQGVIEVSLAEKSGQVQLEVQDDGPGIKAEERSRVFEPFYRVPSGRDAGVKGSGLGLAIVRECVAGHQGKVEVVDPHQGRSGACFQIRLPLDPNV